MTSVKTGLTVVILIAIAVFSYQYLPIRIDQDPDRHDAISLSVAFSPPRIQSTTPVDIDVYLYRAKAPVEELHFHRSSTDWTHTVHADPGTKVLFTAHSVATLTSLDCAIYYRNDRVRYDNKPKDGLVRCDWIVT